jgi:hypothetical protein
LIGADPDFYPILSASFGSDGWVEHCSNLAPKGSCVSYAYIVLPNYFSPNNPTGDPAMLQGAQLDVEQQQDSPISSLLGPGQGG